MRIYSVYRGPTPMTDGDDLEFISEGFSWAALIVPLIWSLYHRLWLVTAGLVIVFVGVGFMTTEIGISASMENVILGAMMILFGFEANNFRRWTMRRRGWRQVAIVSGRDISAAERRLFGVFALTPTGALVPRSQTQWADTK